MARREALDDLVPLDLAVDVAVRKAMRIGAATMACASA
jgi:hypothetical protein